MSRNIQNHGLPPNPSPHASSSGGKLRDDTVNIQQVATETANSNDLHYRRPITSDSTFDNHFRTIVEALDVPQEFAKDLQSLRAFISSFQSTRIQSPSELRSQIIYRVNSQYPGRGPRMFLDKPQWVEGENEKNEILMGDLPIRDATSYLNMNPGVCFIVYRNFPDPSTMKSYQNDAISNPKWQSEVIETVNAVLDKALMKFMNSDLFSTDIVGTTKAMATTSSKIFSTGFLEAPYPAIYHARGERMDSFLESLDHSQQQQFQLLIDYVISQYENEYSAVEAMISNGRISERYLKYLFKPGDVVVQREGNVRRGYLCSAWLAETSDSGDEEKLPEKKSIGKKYTVNAHHWTFNGAFSLSTSVLGLEINSHNNTDLKIDDLDVYPLSCAKEGLALKIQRRGKTLWKCRKKHLVSYHDDTNRELNTSSNERYMIDMISYTHSTWPENSQEKSLIDDLGPGAMEQDEAPSDIFLYLLPTTIWGFNLRARKWAELNADNLSDVVWNTKAFRSLVLEQTTKELIQALVSNQTETERSTDVISGKGNGLILLLHGGPCTGKTLTAESVAEIAWRPLYPITCGEIGTEPEAVEHNLQNILHLGQAWGCVVLLDEADVFLEQRSLEDLRRNALVSVFLRVLEYYEGILILTSNRVGTFDEAFRSRIQLSIHYKNLNAEDRALIWAKFHRAS